MRVHIISIGGSVMHNLAIVLHKQGHHITGSDDEIYEPSRSRLHKYGLLPADNGWNPDYIDKKIDFIILGMHARANNPELLKAIDLGLKILSYPEFIYEQSKNKTRIVIGGSHGKTTTTSLIMRCLDYKGISFDYLIGARVDGFEDMVKISDAAIMIIEGDEYLSSAIDRKPKFLHYNPHISVLTGIDWDHINVFPTYQNYIYQFKLFIHQLNPGSTLIYHSDDPSLQSLISTSQSTLRLIPYQALKRDDNGNIKRGDKSYSTLLFGKHNDANIHAAMLVCKELGITENEFFSSIMHYPGASKRLEIISSDPLCYLDFAHAPSKVKATVSAIREKYPNKKIICLLELHSYSSLNKEFLPNYKDSLKPADKVLVFCNRNTFVHKGMEVLPENLIKKSFNRFDLDVYYDPTDIAKQIKKIRHNKPAVVLIMSSGNFGGIKIKQLFTSGI